MTPRQTQERLQADQVTRNMKRLQRGYQRRISQILNAPKSSQGHVKLLAWWLNTRFVGT